MTPATRQSIYDYMQAFLVICTARPHPIDWSPPTGPRIGGIPPWQGGRHLEVTL